MSIYEVHLKKALISKMPGDRWQMCANLRALYGYMWAHPGKKLLFMGCEIGQWREWNFEGELDWFALDQPDNRGVQRLVRDINRLYQKLPALYELDDEAAGFRWIDCYDAPHSVISFVRFPSPMSSKGSGSGRRSKLSTRKGVHVVAVCNLTPVPRHGYRIGVPRRCDYLELLNTDARDYGGSGVGNLGHVAVEDVPSHGFPQSVVLTLPPLATLWMVPEREEDPRTLDLEGSARELLAAETVFEAAPASAAEGADPRAAEAREERIVRDESTLVSFDRRSVS
jgi:1,4-alpha-glucan branching enzyme